MLKMFVSWKTYRTPIAVAFTILAFAGCDKSNPVSAEDTYQQANLMPIAVGRIWVFTTYSLDTTSSQKILSSVHREASFVAQATTIAGKSCYLMLDSIYTPSNALSRVDTSYLAVENGDLLQWNRDYSQWFTLMKRSAGLNTQYSVGQYQEVQNGAPVSAVFKGIVTAPEQIAVPFGNIQAYKAEIQVSATVGGVSYGTQVADFYFSDGLGPVRTYNPVQFEMGTTRKIQGEESLLVSKNF